MAAEKAKKPEQDPLTGTPVRISNRILERTDALLQKFVELAPIRDMVGAATEFQVGDFLDMALERGLAEIAQDMQVRESEADAEVFMVETIHFAGRLGLVFEGRKLTHSLLPKTVQGPEGVMYRVQSEVLDPASDTGATLLVGTESVMDSEGLALLTSRLPFVLVTPAVPLTLQALNADLNACVRPPHSTRRSDLRRHAHGERLRTEREMAFGRMIMQQLVRSSRAPISAKRSDTHKSFEIGASVFSALMEGKHSLPITMALKMIHSEPLFQELTRIAGLWIQQGSEIRVLGRDVPEDEVAGCITWTLATGNYTYQYSPISVMSAPFAKGLSPAKAIKTRAAS